MNSRLMLAVVLGILLGVGLTYSPPSQPTATAARLQLPLTPITQANSQGNFGAASTSASLTVTQILIPLLVGLLFATPIFLLVRRRAK